MALASCASTDYRSGEVKTTETFTYGRFSTRIQGSGKPGTVGSFFAHLNGSNWTQDEDALNEIDLEIVPSMYDSPLITDLIHESGDDMSSA